MAVPGGHIRVTNWPINAIAKLGWCFKLVLAPALAGATPDQGFAAHLIPSNPVERFFLHVGMVLVFNEKMGSIFIVTRCLADERVLLLVLARMRIAVFELPGLGESSRVVADVFDVAATLQYQGFKALFTQLFGCPATTDPRSNDDGVKIWHSYRFYSTKSNQIHRPQTDFFVGLCSFLRYFSTLNLDCKHLKPTQNL